ncbi:MAG TPA: alpha-L-arabinofuranosidase C-terminal domain-containing protein [Armatimonadota bacterium]|nr:alpha-L-arabinofuranosidase C-terminal domain-containing protein [Armatimonadota bacterium]
MLRNRLKQFAIFCSLTTALSITLSAQAASTATITVDAKHVIGNVQPFVFGHNVEAGDSYGLTPNHGYGAIKAEGLWNPDAKQLVPDMLAMSKEVGVKMMRYPGGCYTHVFNWHDAVGPIDQRPHFSFGVNEFIAYCQAAGAEPLMNVSEYVGTAQDAADLVEYLNAPADAQHPWAQKRAQWGHPEPFHVRYFEMGNESDHGNHNAVPHKQFTAHEYAEWYNTAATLMRKVDPTIKIGPLMGTGTAPTDPWNATVLTMTKGQDDFIIVHTYAVGCSEELAQRIPGDRLMQGCMAAGDQLEIKLHQYRDIIKKYSGKDLPLAVTEYNASFVQEKPIRYRYAYGPALFSADYVRVLLKPETHVLMANYWHLANGYWGMIQGYGPYKKMPAYYLFRLWAQHFGTKLVTVHVTSPRVSFDGVNGVRAAYGNTYQPGKVLGTNLLDLKTINPVSGAGYSTELRPDGTLVATFNQLSTETYPEFAVINAPKTGLGYKITFEARATGNVKNSVIGLGLCDKRGWTATSSAIAVEGMQSVADWTKFEGAFNTLPDCPGTSVLWRLRVNKATPVTGTIEVRNLKVTAYESSHFAAYEAVTSSASTSADGKTLYLMIFNKHMTDDIPVQVSVKHLNGIASVRRWMVTGPSLSALNFDKEEVREVESGVSMPLPQAGLLKYTAPARSMTAIEIQTK